MPVEASLKIYRAANVFFLPVSLNCGVVDYLLLDALPPQWAIFSSASLAIAGFLLWAVLLLSRQ